MIIDSHCHAWSYWPYLPTVPFPESHGVAEQLITQMDLCGVDQATITTAAIWRNRDNNDYIAAAVRRWPDRLHQWGDVDSFWSKTYHTPGAANRLESAAAKWPMKGFTQYIAGEDDGSWFLSPDGLDFWRTASELKLIASIACRPRHQTVLRRLAERFPEVPILCHHMSSLSAREPAPHPELNNVLESAKLPNIYLKLSGFAYLNGPERNWEYPYRDTMWVYKAAFEKFGTRMCWGSDYPPALFYMTYRQSLEAFRMHCDFVPEDAKREILGGTLKGLLDRAKTTGA
jgi:predicted TIM-barrel fold metal-dependent hydrolase